MSTQSIKNFIEDEKTFNSMVDELLNRIDSDNSNDISLSELKTLLIEFSILLEIPLPKESDIEDIFIGNDIDGSGKMSKEEFTKLLKRLILRLTVIFDAPSDC